MSWSTGRPALDRPLVLDETAAARAADAQTQRTAPSCEVSSANSMKSLPDFARRHAQTIVRRKDREGVPLGAQRVGEHLHERCGGRGQQIGVRGRRFVQPGAARRGGAAAVIDCGAKAFRSSDVSMATEWRDHGPRRTFYPQRMTDESLLHVARIAAGEFVMGADDGEADERPAHRAYVDEFCIGRSGHQCRVRAVRARVWSSVARDSARSRYGVRRRSKPNSERSPQHISGTTARRRKDAIVTR